MMCALVALMVIVGGATRLTDSGLSITEWRPVTGAVPPLSQADWQSEFEKYRQIPEYQLVNFGMTLEEFKFIYWWEWGHRFLGRLIGVAFLGPYLFFLAKGFLTPALNIRLIGLFILGGLQGALGWYMVQSGLSERIDVSQYRLAAHLGLALVLFALMFWLALSLRRPAPSRPPDRLLLVGAASLCAAVFVQSLLGALVAGLRAGRTFNTWPLMDGRFFPDGYFSSEPRFLDLFESISAVQFNHRTFAFVVAAVAAWFFVMTRKTPIEPSARLVVVAVAVQFFLGVWTLLAAAPIWLGLAHQAGALVVLASALSAAHSVTRSTSIMRESSSSG